MLPGRCERVAKEVQRVVSEIIRRELADPRVRQVTITRASVSRDLQVARVYYTSLGDERAHRQAHAGLLRAAGFVRRRVGELLRLRVTPEVAFHRDEEFERVLRVEATMDRLKHEGTQRS